jgi:hypothetical protein
MQTTTRQGQTLSVHLEAIHRVPAGHPEPIVVFRYPGGIECAAFYLSHFLSRSSAQALKLTQRDELAPDAFLACRQHCDALMREVFS